MSILYKGKEIKYIASDLDGTLLHGEGHKLDDETYELIQKCIDQGVLFIVASGRTYDNERTVMGPIKDKISYIASSGCMGVHNNEVFAYHTLDKNDVEKMIHISKNIEGYDCLLFVCTTKGNYADSNFPPFFDHLVNNVKIELNLVDDLTSVLNHPIEKVSAFEFNGAAPIVSYFQDELPNFNVVTSGPQWIDFLQKDVNKGNTLKALLKKLDMNPEDGIAFGDQANDIEMLETAGIGYCMKTGVPKAKEVADYVIDSPKEILKELLENVK